MIIREELGKIEYFENDCPIIEWWRAFWFWVFNIWSDFGIAMVGDVMVNVGDVFCYNT
jgi:hypothetical protein